MATRPETAARVLVADDQPDVLEALRWLLTGEGYEPQFVSSTDAVLDRLRAEPVRSAADGSELYPRHDVGARRARADPARARPRPGDADRRHDRLGQHRHRRRGDAPRRARASCRSRGKTSRCSRSCSARSTRRARRKRRDAKQQREFEEARLIQRGLLPTRVPQIAGLDLAVVVAAGQRRRRRLLRRAAVRRAALGVSIADVAGKGVPAALLMSNLQAAVRAFAQDGAAPSSVCASVNRLLCRNMASGRFVTFCYARIDAAARTHRLRQRRPQPAAADSRRRRRRAALAEGGMVLGVFPESTLRAGRASRSAAAIASCSTPTASPRARNAAGDEYGEDRLAAAALARRGAAGRRR